MRKRITYWVVAAVVTGALVVAGMQLANRASGHPPARLPALSAAAQAPAAVGPGQGAQSAQAAPAQVPGIASRAFPAYTIQVRGTLPTLPSSAHAWTLAPGSSSEQAAQVAALAGKLGLRGKPVASNFGWTVTDGTRQLMVGSLGGMPWTFSSQRTVVCGGPGPASGGTYNGPMCPVRGDGGVAAEAGATSPQMVCGARSPNCPTPQQGVVPPAKAVALPSLQSAEQTAFGLLKQLGVEPDTAGVQPLRLADRWQISVPALLGGLPTSGFMWSAGVGAQNRIVSASGFLVTPKQGDNYPLITVQQALDRLRNVRQRVKGPIVMPAEPVPCPPPKAGAQQAACPENGGKPLPRLVRTVTGVRLGLVFASQVLKPGETAASASAADRTAYLVPAFLFRLEGGGWTDEVPVVAVQDRLLTQPPPATMQPLQSGAATGGAGATP